VILRIPTGQSCSIARRYISTWSSASRDAAETPGGAPSHVVKVPALFIQQQRGAHHTVAIARPDVRADQAAIWCCAPVSCWLGLATYQAGRR
jgi:hypothetical protein